MQNTSHVCRLVGIQGHAVDMPASLSWRELEPKLSASRRRKRPIHGRPISILEGSRRYIWAKRKCVTFFYLSIRPG